MTRKLSSNKLDSIATVFCYALNRYKSVLIAYSVFAAILGPVLSIFNILTDPYSPAIVFSVLLKVTACCMAVGLPLLMFSYINNKQAVDVFHALPVTREKLYWGNYLAGLFIIFVPYILMGGIGDGILFLMDADSDLLIWIVMAAGIAFSLYNVMIFVMINCGTIFESIVYFGIFEIGLPGFFFVLFEYMSSRTFGYNNIAAYTYQDICYSLSPVYYLFNRKIEILDLIPAIVSLGLVILGKFLYVRRKSESAGQSFAFRPFFYVGAILISVTAGIGVAMLVDYSDVTLLSAFVGTIIGMIGYFILDSIRNRGLKNLKNTLLISGSTAVFVLAFFGSYHLTGAFGFEDRIPDADEIESVAIDWSYSTEFSRYRDLFTEDFPITSAENIENVLELHQIMVDNKADFRNHNFNNIPVSYAQYNWPDYNGGGSRAIYLYYTLENGSEISRKYSIPMGIAYPLVKISQSRDYVEMVMKEFSDVDDFDCGAAEIYCGNRVATDLGDAEYPISKENTVKLQQAVLNALEKRENIGYFSNKAAPMGIINLSFCKQMYSDFNTGKTVPVVELAENRPTYQSVKDNGYYYLYTVKNCAVPFYESDTELVELLIELGADLTAKTEYAEVCYLPANDMERIIKRGICNEIDFHYGGSYIYPSDSEYRIAMLEDEEIKELLSLITPTGYSYEAKDIISIDGIGYLPLTGCEDEVAEFFASR